MAEHDVWTADDDARLRAALGTLRADVEAVPLSDPRFVRADGARRRRQRFVGWTAAAAAAVVVAGAVGYGQLGRDTTLPTPPAQTPTLTTPTTSTTSSPTTTDPLATPGLLPLAAEWQQALDLPAGSVRVEPVTKGGGVECGAVVGDLDRQESVRVQGATMTAGASHWTVEGSLARAVADLRQSVADCVLGPDFAVKAGTSSKSWWTYRYTTPDAGTGWFVVVGAHDDAVLLQVVLPDDSVTVSQGAVAALAEAEHARLDRYGASATPTGPATTATDEDMPVSGPDPKPSSALFVAASQWTSPFFGKGAKAYAGPGAMEGSTSVITCETDAQQAGVAGRVGVVNIRAGAGDANYVGKQRVRVFDDVRGYELVQADLQRIDQLVTKGCSSADGANRTTAERGPVQGTYLLTTRVTGEATGTQYQWVGVTGMQTEGGVATIVFHGTGDGQGFQGSRAEGFDQLLRLMDLARQK